MNDMSRPMIDNDESTVSNTGDLQPDSKQSDRPSRTDNAGETRSRLLKMIMKNEKRRQGDFNSRWIND